jgi:hypothetical protein
MRRHSLTANTKTRMPRLRIPKRIPHSAGPPWGSPCLALLAPRTPKGDRRDNREDEEDKRERYQPERKGDDRGRVLP